MRHLVQALCVALVLGAAVYLPQRGQPPESNAAPSLSLPGSILGDEEDQLDEFASSPAFEELQQSLQGVYTTRERLLQTAAQAKAPGASKVHEEYQRAVQRLHAAITRVKERVALGDLDAILENAVYRAQMQAPAGAADYRLRDWEIGAIPHEVTP